MESILAKTIESGGPWAMVLGIMLLVVWRDLKNSKEDVKENTKATVANTLALTKLEIQMDGLKKLLIDVEKLKLDVNAAHVKLRQQESRT